MRRAAHDNVSAGAFFAGSWVQGHVRMCVGSEQ